MRYQVVPNTVTGCSVNMIEQSVNPTVSNGLFEIAESLTFRIARHGRSTGLLRHPYEQARLRTRPRRADSPRRELPRTGLCHAAKRATVVGVSWNSLPIASNCVGDSCFGDARRVANRQSEHRTRRSRGAAHTPDIHLLPPRSADAACVVRRRASA